MLGPRRRLDLPGLGRWFDLSGPIVNGMWEYGPPIPKVWIEEVTGHGGPRRESNIHLSLPHLAGTYLETALHRFSGKKSLDELAMDDLIRPATVLQLPILDPLHTISVEQLTRAAGGKKLESALLVSTGWENNWDGPDFVRRSPHFSQEAMEWMMAQGVRLLGADLPCFDHPQTGGNALNHFFEAGGDILAPVVGLRPINTRRVLLMMAPLAVKGICGAPCRAFAAEWPESDEQ